MLAVGSLLAQLRPADAFIQEAVAGVLPTTEITAIYIANTSQTAQNFRMFHSPGPTDVTTEATALFWDKSIPQGDTLVIRAAAMGGGIMLAPGQKLFVRSGIANALTFSIYGVTAQAADAAVSTQRGVAARNG